MSAILEHARKHYFKGAYALTLFGDLSAIGGVPTYDAYGIQVPKPDILLLPFRLTKEQEDSFKKAIPELSKGHRIEAVIENETPTIYVRRSGKIRRSRSLSINQEGERLKLVLLDEKEEPLLDLLLRETVLGEALIEYWIKSGFFKRRSLEDFGKQMVVESALEEHAQEERPRQQVSAEEATRELEKAHHLLLQIAPKSVQAAPTRPS